MRRRLTRRVAVVAAFLVLGVLGAAVAVATAGPSSADQVTTVITTTDTVGTTITVTTVVDTTTATTTTEATTTEETTTEEDTGGDEAGAAPETQGNPSDTG